MIASASELSAGEFRDLLISVAAVITALTVIWKFMVKPIVAFARRLDAVMSNVEQQLYPNSGSSLRDQVTAIQTHLGIPVHLPDHGPINTSHKEDKP